MRRLYVATILATSIRWWRDKPATFFSSLQGLASLSFVIVRSPAAKDRLVRGMVGVRGVVQEPAGEKSKEEFAEESCGRDDQYAHPLATSAESFTLLSANSEPASNGSRPSRLPETARKRYKTRDRCEAELRIWGSGFRYLNRKRTGGHGKWI